MPVLKKRRWDAEVVDLPSATVPAKICELVPGEAVVIKHIGTSSKYIMIGTDDRVSTTKGYKLTTSLQKFVMKLGKDDTREYVEIWGLPETAGDDVTYAKVGGQDAAIDAT